VDARIDREANYIKSTFNYPFFLTIWHEPENDVNPNPASGMTATDYAAMFRHVVQRLRADGVNKVVTVMTYMSYLPMEEKPWRSELYPGNDVVDWLAVDSYLSGAKSGYMAGDFDKMMNKSSSTFPGFYNWATSHYPGKPIMLGEWGVLEDPSNPGGKPAFFRSVASEIGNFPDLKALVYFDMPHPPDGRGGSTSPDSTPEALQAFEALRRDPAFVAPQVVYGPGGSVTG
jgi:beta-mannanase